MDHMRFSNTEISSVILRQTYKFKKLKSDAKDCQNKLKPKRITKRKTVNRPK